MIMTEQEMDEQLELMEALSENCEVKMTNADKIRAMTDEELAEYLVNFKNIFGEEYEGEMSCLDWLQKEIIT